MERCPNCGARLDANRACRRCGMDLSGLLRAEQAAESLVLQGIERLAADPEAAAQLFSRSLALRKTPFAQRLLRFARRVSESPEQFVEPRGSGGHGDDSVLRMASDETVPLTTIQPDNRW